MNESKPTKEGELRKYKNVWFGWGTRYFKLERMYLHYFESKYAPTPVNTVTRGDIDKVKLSDSFPDKKNVFEVHTKSGIVWYLQCATPEEMWSWMTALMPQHTECTKEDKENQGQQTAEPVEPTAPPVSRPPHQGPYTGPLPHIYPDLYGPGSPYHDLSVHGGTEHSPPPSYEETLRSSPSFLEKSS